MMGPARLTAKQKAYSDACDACRYWAKWTPAETLRHSENDRVAKSYGITAKDAGTIIKSACTERGL